MQIWGIMLSFPRLSPSQGQIGRASCRGKSVDLGGRRIIKKKNKHKKKNRQKKRRRKRVRFPLCIKK